MQTSREVVNALLRGEGANGEKPERMALMDSPWPETVWAWVQQGYPTRPRYRKLGQTYRRRSEGSCISASIWPAPLGQETPIWPVLSRESLLDCPQLNFRNWQY